MFATLIKHTPLFNQRDIKGSLLAFDDRYLVRALEMILFEGTICRVVDNQGDVLLVSPEEYPMDIPLYIDSRFAILTEEEPAKKIKTLKSPKKILEKLLNYPKVPYIWGGNVAEGIPEMLELFPPSRPLTPFEYNYWQFRGVDCSGIFYEVTDGFLPRNVKEMRKTLPIVSSLKPLDLITLINNNHVLIALPNDKVLECREFDGVVISSLTERLREVEHREPLFHRWI